MRGETAEPDWEAELNPEQLEAVTWGDGPLVVFAGAGSGKTRVITYRILHLVLARNVRASRILGLTFTNRAAGEMRDRIRARMADRPPLLGTFHAFCARLLRMHGTLAGIDPGFAIYSERDQLAVLRQVVEELGLDPARMNPRTLRGWLDARKRDLPSAPPDGKDVLSRIHAAYEARLARQGALDFNDLLLRAIELLERNEGTRQEIAERYLHVLVDEFQDTNRVQMRLLELLAPPPSASLTVVGDDDQSIYRWRGARVRNILEFRELYPYAHIVKLERNYRSSANILAAAQAVIEKNPTRAPKRLWTDRPAGEPIGLYVASSEADEARHVAARAREMCDAGLPFWGQAILYRIHAQSRAIEEALRAADVPYRIVGGTRFFDRAEIRDLVACLRLAQNPHDDVAFMRVHNTPPRGIGARTIGAVRDEAARSGASLFEASCRADPGRRAGKALAGLATSIRGWNEFAATEPPSRVLERIVEETAFAEHLERAHGEEAEARLLNVRELIAGIRDYEMEEPDAGLGALLERIALHTDLDDLPEGTDAVVLMTVHSAKGLEFDSVTITGLEEDLFPFVHLGGRETLSPEEQEEELHEERRLFYVAVTRARRHLALTCSRKRQLFGAGTRYRAPSIFLDEIPASLVRHESWFSRGALADPAEDAPDQRPAGIQGTRVRHARFGTGSVVRVEEGVRRKLVIRFDDGRTRKIIEDFVKPA